MEEEDKSHGRTTKKRKLVLFNEDEDEDLQNVYRFKVLLPNGVTVGLTLKQSEPEISCQAFVRRIKEEYDVVRRQPELVKGERPINWNSQKLYFQDANDNKTSSLINLRHFKPHKSHIISLHDGSEDFAKTFKVIKSFANPEFFHLVFPMLFDMCNSTSPNKTGRAPLASDTTKAESDEAEDVSIPVDKLMNCITSCIQVASVTDILEQKKKLLDLFLISLSPGFQWIVKISAFSSVKELCSRLCTILDDSEENSLYAGTAAFVQEENSFLYLCLPPLISF